MTAQVRACAEADAAAVRAVVTEAFGEDDGPVICALVDDLRLEHARVELVALDDTDGGDGGVVGHVLLSRSWLDTRRALLEVLVLSPLSVRPSHQRRGVGTRLLAAALDAARSQGVPAVFLEGDPGYYGDRGWEPGAVHGFGRPSARIPEAAFMVVVLTGHEPWMTGALVYCDPFWSHDCVGLRDPQLGQFEQMFEL